MGPKDNTTTTTTLESAGIWETPRGIAFAFFCHTFFCCFLKRLFFSFFLLFFCFFLLFFCFFFCFFLLFFCRFLRSLLLCFASPFLSGSLCLSFPDTHPPPSFPPSFPQRLHGFTQQRLL